MVASINFLSFYLIVWWFNIPFEEALLRIFVSEFTWFEFCVVLSFVLSLVLTKIFTYKVLNFNLYKITKNFLRTIPLNLIVTIFILGELLALSFLCNSSVIASEYVNYPQLDQNNTELLGLLIYTDYFYMFQIGGMILLLAMIGAISLTLHSQKSNVIRQNVTEQLSRTKHDTLRINKVVVGKGVDV